MATLVRQPKSTPVATKARTLRRIQRWMQACIVADGPTEAALHTSSALKEFPPEIAANLIRPSRSLSALERLDIYRKLYEARLLDALRTDYPTLACLLGDGTFAKFVKLYVREYPSQTCTPDRIGEHFPLFLKEAQGLPNSQFFADLAQFELASTEVFHEAESPVATPDSLSGRSPESWAAMRFRPIHALRTLWLAYPVHEFADAVRGGSELPKLRPKRTHLIVYRRDYSVFHMALTAPAFAMFRSLAEGNSLGEATEDMFSAGGARRDEVFAWFQRWFTERVIAHVEME